MRAIGIVLAVLLIIGLLAVGPACWHYSVNTWLHLAHKPETFGWGLSIVLAFVLAPASVPVALITYIVTLFM